MSYHPPDGHNNGKGEYTPSMNVSEGDFEKNVKYLTRALAAAPVVNVGEWQAIRDESLPMMDTIEVEDISLYISLPQEVEDWQKQISPNLPWAEEHFGERVSGIPYNPPPSHVRWPFAQKDNSEHTDSDKFSHTYPERFWPKWINEDNRWGGGAAWGIRFNYGDLNDLIALLRERPATRQAYLPIWFPEDLTAVHQDQRVPCSLGYHFMIREGKLKITYYIRSCDFYRHFRDDVYLAGRLGQYVAKELGVGTSRLVMHISSLHIFSAERSRIEQEASPHG